MKPRRIKGKRINVEEVRARTDAMLAGQSIVESVIVAAEAAQATMPPIPGLSEKKVVEFNKVWRNPAFEDTSEVKNASDSGTKDPIASTDKPIDSKPEKPKTDWAAIVGTLKTLEDVQGKLLELTANPRCPSRILKNLRETSKTLLSIRKAEKADEKTIPKEAVKKMLRSIKNAYCGSWSTVAGERASYRILEQMGQYAGKDFKSIYPELGKAIHAFACEVSNDIIIPACEAELLKQEQGIERL